MYAVKSGFRRLGAWAAAAGIAAIALLSSGQAAVEPQNQLQFQSAAAKPSYAEIAAHWAPVICQDIDDANMRAEYITRFDYDGDFRGRNNWDNLDSFDLPGYIYYWVTETPTHYFVGYGFFHPRDWHSHRKFFDEHENDMEGILLTIRKSGRFGHFQAMVTVAHHHHYSYTDQDAPPQADAFPLLSGSRAVRNGREDIDGDVDFVHDDFGLHPVVYSESEGHGVYGVRGKVSDSPPIFDSTRVMEWRGVRWTGIGAPRMYAAPTRVYNTSGWDDGIIYHYERTADVPARARVKDKRQLPHRFEVVGYDLLSIKPLWDRRNDFQSGKETFEKFGTFDGDDGQNDAANAPWGWDDSDDGPIGRGFLFTEPARLVDHYFSGLGSFDRRLIGNSYQ